MLGLPMISTIVGLALIGRGALIRNADLQPAQRMKSFVFTILWSSILQFVVAIIVGMNLVYGITGLMPH